MIHFSGATIGDELTLAHHQQIKTQLDACGKATMLQNFVMTMATRDSVISSLSDSRNLIQLRAAASNIITRVDTGTLGHNELSAAKDVIKIYAQTYYQFACQLLQVNYIPVGPIAAVTR